MGVRHVVVWVLAATMLAAPGAVGLTAAPKPKVERTKGYVAAIAMDGPLVAYDVEAALQGPRCNRLFVWDVVNGSGTLASGKGTCGADDTSTGAGVSEIAVAGKRVAWLVNLGGNTESVDYLYTASLPKPKEVRLATATRTGDVDCVLEGRQIGGLVGDAGTLALNIWTLTAAGPGTCDTGVSKARLDVIDGAKLTTINDTTLAWLAESADRGRIAVVREDGTVALFTKGGSVLRTLAPSSVKEVALRKDYLVVLTKAGRLEVFGTRTGARLFTRRVPAGAAHLDVHAGIAIYAVGGTVRALQLVSGRSAVVATAPRRVIGLELEAPGAAYAYNSPYTAATGEVGNVVFLPFAKLRAALF